MWNRVSGKLNGSKDNLPSQSSRRNDSDAPRSDSIAPSASNNKSSSRADARELRGFNPTSTSFSSTTRGQYPGAASASVASSYATASGNNNDEPYMAPGLVRNASLADHMPTSSLSRSSRDRGEAGDIRDKKQDEKRRSDDRDGDTERRRKREKRERKEKGLRKSENAVDEDVGTSRGPGDFPDQVSSSTFSQFPGQYDEALPGPGGAPPEHSAMSSHVQDQFPGQFPTQSSAPYRPPLAASEGGPGLAAEYYGDDGQSVAEQPGNRANTPSLIIGAEPHLQPALAVAAPPPEPSASGAVGAAASFFSGEFEGDEFASTQGQEDSSTYATSETRPNSNYHSSSAPVIPTIGGAAIGSAAGYFIDGQISSHQQHPDPESIGGPPSEYSAITTHRPQSQTQDSHYSSASRPPKPGSQSSQMSNIPMYAAGAAGAAGLAAAAYEHNHHSSNHDFSSMPQYSTTSTAQRHRNQGPFGALVDFFRDPEGVAQFEEYSQIIGVCRHCFAPGSSPREAPRKHLYGRRRSNERFGSSTRVDKESRYHSSENEGRRKNKKSWLATGLAGYGLAKVGESLFKGKSDFDDTHSVKTGGSSPDRGNRGARRRSHSEQRVESGITGDGKSDRKGQRDDTYTGTRRTTYSTGGHSRTRSRSKDRKTGLTETTIGAALEASVGTSSSRRRSRSPKGTPVKSTLKGQEPSPERRHETKRKKKDRGFFGFGNGSSSSSSVDVAYTSSGDKHRSSKGSNGKSKDDKKAEAALLGLGAAAAALALNDGRQRHRKKSGKELVGGKSTKDYDRHGSGQAHRSKKSSGNLDDELWESAGEDDYESIDSDLAYGAPVRRDSRESLSSASSGTNKRAWRWGSKKNRRLSSPRRKSSAYSSIPAVAGAVGAVITSQDQRQSSAMDSTSSLPLQQVYPVPTSDPSRFDVGRESSITSSSRPVASARPEAVPLQHPRPIAPVSAAVYSSQTAYDHSYSAPTGPAVFSQTPYHHNPGTFDAQHKTNEASIPGSFPRFERRADDTARDFRIRRRDTSPGRLGEDSISSSVAPRRRTSAKDDGSAVRFDLTEEQEERDRRERRRKRKEDKERREVEEQEQIEKDRRASKESSSRKSESKTKSGEDPERHSEKSWAASATAGVIGAAIGAAAATDRSRSEDAREERRERRRRERELEEEEDALSKSDRRRRQRERDDQEAAPKKPGKFPNDSSASHEYVDVQERSPEKQNTSVWQEAASTKRSSSHESYGAFFTPLEFLNRPSDQVKVTSANADADIDLEHVPQIVTVEPKRIHDISDSPTFSLADNDDKIDPSKLSFPWQVPRLRLVEPTPPSTRGSTPVPHSKDACDEGSEEPRKERSPSKIKWGDDQTHEYTIIAPSEGYDEVIEPPSEGINGADIVDSSRSTHERDLPGHEMLPHTDSTIETSSAAYGEDAEFAAALAASAEDAGFDPSIVINNPTYRRRDSPPGSNERTVPGEIDDGNVPRLTKKERRRKEKGSKRQSLNDSPNGRDEDAIVQDMIRQVEGSEIQPSNQVSSEDFGDDRESINKIESKKSNQDWKESESRDDVFDASEIASKVPSSKSRDVYQSPDDDIRSIVSTGNEAESDIKSAKESKRDSTGLDDAASTVTSPSMTGASKETKSTTKDKRKGSIWDQILGKSTRSLPPEKGAKDITDEAILETFKEPKGSKGYKERKFTRDREDDHNDNDSSERSSIGGTTPQDSGRISQDLPAKVCKPVPGGRTLSTELLINSQYQGSSLPSTFSDAGSVAQYLDHGTKPEQVEEKQPESFLGMRPEPPPPPDKRDESEKLSNPLQTTSLPTSPRAESDTQSRRFSDAEISKPTQATAALPASPTAVPFHFRRPARSSSSARSLSQTPLSSDINAADLPPKQKTRPRSTEFKSSKEIRPLWLVERHRSHQEPTPDEIYPSLPSSHTTSRSSSIHDLEGGDNHARGDYELNKAEHESIEFELAPMISTDSHLIQSDLLDSQQATPTDSFFHESRTVQDLPSSQASRDFSSKVFTEENPNRSSSTLKGGVLDAIQVGSTAGALSEAIQNNDLPRQDLSQEENEDLEKTLDDMVLDPLNDPSYNGTLDPEKDFAPQRTKKGKKNKRKAGQSQQDRVPASLADTAEAKPSVTTIEAQPLGPESMRHIQERDAQDAVDSWFPSVVQSKKGKKSKKGKGNALVERIPEESGTSSIAYEPPRDELETTVPAEGQEIDILTREMSREQMVDAMTAAAQDSSKDENKAFQSTIAINQGPSEMQAKENRSELKGKKGKEGQKSLPQDDLTQDDLSQDRLQTKTLPKDGIPQAELPQDHVPQDNLHRSDVQQETLPKYEFTQLESQQNTHSQGDSELAQINLPQDDSSQSQEPKAGSLLGDPPPDSLPESFSSAPAHVDFTDPFPESGDGNVLDSYKANPASQEETGRDESTSPLLELSPRATRLPDSDDDHDLLDERQGTPVLTSRDQLDKKEMEIGAENPLEIPHIHETREKDGPLPNILTPSTLKDDWPPYLNDEPATETLREKSEIVEDEWDRSTSKRKGKKRNKPQQNFLAQNSKITEIQEGQESLPKMTTSKAPEDRKALKLIDESAIEVSESKSETLEAEGVAFDSNKDGKKIEMRRSETVNLGPGTDETEHQVERQPDARDEMNDRPASLATTRTSQEVRDMLGLEVNEASIGGESKEAFQSVSQAEHNLQRPSKNQVFDSDERDPSVLYEPRTPQFEDAPGKALDNEMSATLDTSVAGTNAAQVVQDILTGKDNGESVTDANRQSMVASTGMDETATNRPIEEEGIDWDAPKKKRKSKKGKKNEFSAWDEPKTIEPAEISDPARAMNSSLEQEPAADRLIVEDEPDRDAPKKKKKGKKGKKNEAFFLDEPEITEPAEVFGPPAGMNPPLLEQDRVVEAIDDVSPQQSKKDKKNKKGKRKGVSRAVSDFRDEDEPNVVPTEIPQIEDKEVDRSAVDHPLVISDVREEVESNLVLTEAPQQDDDLEDLPAGATSPIRAESGALEEALEPAVPREFAQDNENEEPRGTLFEQEQGVMPPKGKKDRRKSKKSKKSNTFTPGDETPTIENGQSTGIEDLENDGPEQIIPTRVDVVEESDKTVPKTELDWEQDFMQPTNPEDKKEPKISNAFSLGNDVSPPLEGEPVSKIEDLGKEAPEQTFPSSVDVVKTPGAFVEDLSEEKKDKESTEKVRPFELQYEDITAQSEQETAQELKKNLEIESDSNKPNATEDPATHNADVLKDNIVPAVETDTESFYSLKPSKKDKKKAKKAQSLNQENVSQERRAALKDSSATEDPREPSIIPVSQDSESWSKPETPAQKVESTQIIQPGMRSGEYQGHQGIVSAEHPLQAIDDVNTMVEAEEEESFVNAKKGRKGERTKGEELFIPEREIDRSIVDEKGLAWVKANNPIQGNEETSEQQLRDNLNTAGEMRSDPQESVGELKGEGAAFVTEPRAIEEAKDEVLPWDVPVQRPDKSEKKHDEAQMDEPRIEDLSSSTAPEHVREIVETVHDRESDTNVEPLVNLDESEQIPAVEVAMLDAQGQREHKEEYANELERATPNTEPVADLEPLEGPGIDKPIPAVEVEMLDAQEQRDYNEEYARELERQLSPLQEGERAVPSRDEADTVMFSNSSINSVMERPYEEEHRPLARPPALEDIIEESRSRSGSAQGNLVDQEDVLSPVKSSKRSKKGKKRNKPQSVIWEDETATPPLQPESDQGAHSSIISSGGPDSWDTNAARPQNLEEIIEQHPLEDRTIASPTRGFDTADNEPGIQNDQSNDYFAIQPSRPAEEDVGREDTHEFRRALSATRDLSPTREAQTVPGGHPRNDAIEAYSQVEDFGSLATNFHDKSRMEAETAAEEVEDDLAPASVKNTKNGNEYTEKASPTKPNPQAPSQEDFMEGIQDMETSATDILNERSPSRQHSLRSPSHEEDKLPRVADGRSTSGDKSGSMEIAAAAAGLGVGTLAAETLSVRDPGKKESHGKKAKEGDTSADLEAGTGDQESSVDRGEMAFREQEDRQTPESENAVRARQYHQATPPLSPPSTDYEAMADRPLAGELGQSSDPPKYRDSAVYVPGSPVILEEAPYRRGVRDSGYPDTEASPIVDELKDSDDLTESERSGTAGDRVGHVQHRHSRAHEADQRQRSTSRNSFEISVEATSDYDVSVSRPRERRKRSRRRSGAAHDSDDSADSGFDIQRRRRRQATAAEPREPSPVSSTTKDRSSALFDSSPSARREQVAKPQNHDVSPRNDLVGEEPLWSFDRDGWPQQRSREASKELRSDPIPERAPEPTDYNTSAGNDEDTGTSLFGGPRSYKDEMQSPSRSSRSSESRGRGRLNTISEDRVDGSPLHKKDKRAVSDVGSPESGVKGRRMQSPPVKDDVAGERISAHDPISRQPWGAADEERGAVLDERSRSRNSDQVSIASSRHSTQPGVTPKQREGEYRTASAASMQSEKEKSIYAIIRTPDQVRSASGLSYRSSATPPLRRVDRSASGDLRGASKNSQAKNGAKSSSELETDAELNIGIPSSSTYDPVTDKGKSRADMADVYVSLHHRLSSRSDSGQD